MDSLQRQVATLKKLNSPSDDPIGAAKVLELRTDKVNNGQFQLNSKLAETFLSNTDHALEELSELVLRAKEIALRESSGASSNDESRLGVAEEVSQIYQQAVATANRRIGERYLFGGYKTNTPPVDADGKYRGDRGEMMTEIAKDVYLASNIPGEQVFSAGSRGAASLPAGEAAGGGSPRVRGREPATEGGAALASLATEVNLFDELQKLRIHLLTGDIDGVRETLERFDTLRSNLVGVRAKVGSRLSAIQNTVQSLERHNVTNASQSSFLEDADMAQVVSDLAKEETVFRSALQSAQKLIQPTLMDFIK
jgi:flagellar hook-associated protein 3 FlgL